MTQKKRLDSGYMGFRFILFVVAIAAVWMIFRHQLARRQINKPGVKKVITGNMVACEKCGLHLPEDEAIQHDGKYFCCAQHAETDDQAD